MFWMCIRIASVRRFLYTSTTYDFMEKYGKLFIFIILIPTPDFPHFYYMLGGNLGSHLYGDVSVMTFLLPRVTYPLAVVVAVTTTATAAADDDDDDDFGC